MSNPPSRIAGALSTPPASIGKRLQASQQSPEPV